jgi:hypothetical protein
MRWHAPACRVASPLPIPVQLARANGVRTNALHIASMQGRYHCDVAAASCYARIHTRRSTAAPCRHLPLSLLAQALPPAFSCRPVRGIATIPWGSMFLSSDHWVLTASHATMERCAHTVGCQASRECSRARSRRRAGAAPGPASLACGLHEQTTGPRRVGHALREPGHEVHCRPGPRANFGPVAQEFKKIIFYFSFGFKLNSNLKNYI